MAVFSRRRIILVCVAHLLLIQMEYTILNMNSIAVEYLRVIGVTMTIISKEIMWVGRQAKQLKCQEENWVETIEANGEYMRKNLLSALAWHFLITVQENQ
jgi:hypothetical protein